MRKIISAPKKTSGIPLGGFGTGTVEIKPDGTLAEWQIINAGLWISNDPGYLDENARYDISGNTLAFYARVKNKRTDDIFIRRLGLDITDGEFRKVMYPWVKCVPQITFEGDFAGAALHYDDPALPVSISARFGSPFIPYKVDGSSLPALEAEFTVENKGGDACDVSVLCLIKNPVMTGQPERRLATEVYGDAYGKCILMGTLAGDSSPSCGSFAVHFGGDAVTAVPADYNLYFNNYVLHSKYGVMEESVLFDFYKTGHLHNSTCVDRPSAFLKETADSIKQFTEAQADRCLSELSGYASINTILTRLKAVKPDLFLDLDGKIDVLCDLRKTLNTLNKKKTDDENAFGDGALCSFKTVKPKEQTQFVCTVSWHFPNHYDRAGTFVGHEYTNRFDNAKAVNDYVRGNRGYLNSETRKFVDTMYNSSLPAYVVESYTSQLTTLRKCSYYTKSGDFAIWEGLGCCGLHTTDITYQGSFPLITLFPELQKKQMRLSKRFQKSDGSVPHCITPGMCGCDNGFDRVDLNPQFILMVCRDYIFTGDKAYLAEMWQAVKAALRCMETLDADGDGLPDHDTGPNTYDAWKFEGTPAYIGSLWLAARKAVIRMAETMGETELAAEQQARLETGIAAFDEKLWNGSYYRLWQNGDNYDNCCMADQIDGEWFLKAMGFANALPAERINQALKSVFKNNFTPEGGLKNAVYPKGETHYITHTYENVQGLSNWTGVEYCFAVTLLYAGLYEQGLEILHNIDSRHALMGREWNHQECGNHYFRALSAFTVLNGITGFSYDAAKGHLAINPSAIAEEFTAPFCTSSAYGTLTISNEKITIDIVSGELLIQSFETANPSEVLLNGKRYPKPFAEPVTLFAGDKAEFVYK